MSKIDQAIALDGLHFDLVDAQQTRRLASALHQAAEQIIQQVNESTQPSPLDQQFAEALVDLKTRLRGLLTRPAR